MSEQDPFSYLPLRKRLKHQDGEIKPVKKLKRGRPPKSTTTNDIYCICKRPYDVTRFMIACDKCNDWFHGECIGISEKQGEFIHLYFCDHCSNITGKQTSWKPNCANPTCSKPASLDSPYCTENCDQVQQQYSLSTRKLVIFADMDDRARLARVKEERILVKSRLSIIEKKLALLELLKKKQDTCGFDSRLTWPEHVWSQVDQVVESKGEEPHFLYNAEGEPVTLKTVYLCQQVNCPRHKQWYPLKLTELENERSEQSTISFMLERERLQVKARMKKRREDNDFLD